MTPQKFIGSTSREVLKKVRQALGEDALIVSNRPFGDRIEVTALCPADLKGNVTQVNANAGGGRDSEGMVAELLREMGAMKAMMQSELAGIGWTNLKSRSPARASMMKTLLDAGFSPALARELIATVAADAPEAATRTTVIAEIDRRLPLIARESLVEDGGVYALVGSTGVGKTTTIAKLAARCVVRRGADSLALLSTDSYRIAAQEQLRVYGKILNVPVHAIKDAEHLKMMLTGFHDKKTVLIDTIGMSQRDQHVAEQTALLMGDGTKVKRLLLLNATANAATLDEVVRAYSKGGIHGCIITKVDESASVVTALDVAIRHRLPVHYMTNGQRVPEDLHLPNRAYLLHRALQPIKDGAAHFLQPDELPLMLTPSFGASHG